MGTTAGAPKGRAYRSGPWGTGWATAVVLVVVVLAGVLAYGIHGMVDRPHLNLSDPHSWLPKQQLDHPVDRTSVERRPIRP